MTQLPEQFYQIPATANTTMTTKDLRELLLKGGGWIIACGISYDIESRPLGAGVHRVWLKERK